MPSTQAYSVSWDVEIQPEGDVSEDVAEITAVRQEDVDSATVKLDTSESPHALEEDRAISIEISDGNDTIQFTGKTDSVKDHATDPVVTIDARSTEGWLDDITAAGRYDRSSLFRVIDGIINDRPGKIDAISFDPAAHEDRWGTLQSSTDYGWLYYNYSQDTPSAYQNFNQHETAEQPQQIEIRVDDYVNTTGNTYAWDIHGLDGNGDQVTATLELPPADNAQEAWGAETFKLALSDGQQMAEEITSVDWDGPMTPDLNHQPSGDFFFEGQIFNFVKTDWNFNLNNLRNTRQAIQAVVNYISSRNSEATWEAIVNDSDELIIRPNAESRERLGISGGREPETFVFREGDNVLKPVAKRDLDGVRNMVKVQGSGVTAYAWAYGGDFYFTYANPFIDDGIVNFPNDAATFDTSPADGQNDIDKIGMRAEALNSPDIDSYYQVRETAQRALREYYATPISGTAPVPGIMDIYPGDRAEVYYPSRGIPAKVDSNIFDVKKVEYSVTPEKATTRVEFGTKERNLGDMISSGGQVARTDVSQDIRTISQTYQQGQGDGTGTGGGGGGTFPVVGTLQSQNGDGTWTVEGENGEIYTNVRVI